MDKVELVLTVSDLSPELADHLRDLLLDFVPGEGFDNNFIIEIGDQKTVEEELDGTEA